jgi:hypothetical protein
MIETETIPTLKKEVLQALPISTQRGVEELINRYLIMRHSSHPEDKFVIQIKRSMETFFLLLEEAHCDEMSSRLLDQLHSIEDGIAFIKGAITNRLHAARYLYEPSLFNPHSMGPFSNLYLFYENFVDLFERLATEYNKLKDLQNAQSRVDFLVDISIYSSVSARPFVPYSCKKTPENILVGITINEHAFFQIEATIVLLLHEIGHYIRPFNRTSRNKLIREIAFNWLASITFSKMADYLNQGIFSPNFHPRNNIEEENIRKVKYHIEAVLKSIIDPVLIKIFNKNYDRFINLEEVTSEFKSEDPNACSLRQYQPLLDNFLIYYSSQLGEILFAPQKIPLAEGFPPPPPKEQDEIPSITSDILEILDEETILKQENPNPSSDYSYFATLCEEAIALFNTEEVFIQRAEENTAPDSSFSVYLKSLSLLGINEASKTNKIHFSKVLMQCVKMAVEQMKDEDVLETIIRNLDEALAHMFWIRTLDIKDFESYWKIVFPLMKQTVLDEDNIIINFGVPNAIITEYFNLLQQKHDNELAHYDIPTFDTSLLSQINEEKNSNASSENQGLQEAFFRDTIFVPIADYLFKTDDVFPEKQFFQVSDSKALSADGILVKKLRDDFRQFVSGTGEKGKLAQEIQMINFFNEHSESSS